MGFRFRRSFKVAPGFRLNFSKVGVEHVGWPPRAMVHDRPAQHAYDCRDLGHWVELHGTIEVAQSRRAGRQQHRHAGDATIRCIGLTIRNANVERPDARDRVARDRWPSCRCVPTRAPVGLPQRGVTLTQLGCPSRKPVVPLELDARFSANGRRYRDTV
jgi:Protein of unknown function (DUF4236)